MIRNLYPCLFLLLSISCTAQEVYIKISPYECTNCANIVEPLLKMIPQTKLVLQEEFKSDSVDIFEHLPFARQYQNNLTWSDSLYNALSQHQFSELVITNNNSICYRATLRNVQLDEITSFIKVFSLAHFQLPSYCNLIHTHNQLLIENYLSRKFFQANNKNDSYLPIDYNEQVIEKLYKEILKDTLGFSLYLEEKETWKPDIAGVFIANDSITYALLVTYRTKDISNTHDTVLAKVLSLVTINYGRIENVFPIDISGLNDDYQISEGSFFIDEGNLYLEAAYNGNQNTINNYKFLAKFAMQSKAYHFTNLSDWQRHKSAVDYEIGNNYFKYLYSNGYLTFCISDYIIDMKSQKTIRIPFPDSLFSLNKTVMSDHKLNFANVDIKYNKYKGEFIILYRVNGKFYTGRFSAGKRIFDSTKLLLDPSAWSNDKLSGICLSDDGEYLLYSTKANKKINLAKIRI